MYPRTEYEMTEQDLKTLLEACRPTPLMAISGGRPMFDSPQENANRAWAALGKKMGFDSDTVQPLQGKGQRFFSAVPSETEEARKERMERETEEKRQRDITKLTEEIAEREQQLAALKATGSEAI